MAKKILILGASRYYQKSIEYIKKLGYKVFVIDKNPESPGFKSADDYAAIDIIDKEKAFEYASVMKIDGVLALNDFGVLTAAYISEKLNLNGVNTSVAQVATNKFLMREKWNEGNVPIPNYYVSDNLEDAEKKLSLLKFPIIVKPVDSRGGGSRGVKVVFEKKDFEKAFNFAQSFYEDKNIIVENCVTGTEHSIEVVIINKKVYILAISEKVKTPYPYRVDKKVVYPAKLTNEKYKHIEEVVEKSISTLEINNAVVHIELAMTENGPVLFEIGVRCGGGATPQIVEEISGIKYLELAAKIAVNDNITEEELKPKFDKSSIYHFFILTEKDGVVKEIKNLDKIQNYNEITDFEMFYKVGDKIQKVRTGSDRHGFAVIISNTRENCESVSNKIDNEIKIII